MTYQSAESSLYNGVTHQRLVMMIDPDHLLIVDRLNSASVHTYQQMFHLFPGAKLSRSGLTVSGTGGTPYRQVTIQQLQSVGISRTNVINQRGHNLAGLCSEQYGVLLPCYQISYSKHSRDATFVTLITIGNPPQTGFAITDDANGRQLQVTDGQRHVSLTLGESVAKPVRSWASDPTPPPVKAIPVHTSTIASNWTATGGGVLSSGHARANGNGFLVRLSMNSSSPVYLQNNAVRLNLVQQCAAQTGSKWVCPT